MVILILAFILILAVAISLARDPLLKKNKQYEYKVEELQSKLKLKQGEVDRLNSLQFENNKKINELKSNLSKIDGKYQKKIQQYNNQSDEIIQLKKLIKSLQLNKKNELEINSESEVRSIEINIELQESYKDLESSYDDLNKKYLNINREYKKIKSEYYSINNKNLELLSKNEELLEYKNKEHYNELLKNFDIYVDKQTKKIELEKRLVKKNIRDISVQVKTIINSFIENINTYKDNSIAEINEYAKNIDSELWELRNKKEELKQEIDDFEIIYQEYDATRYDIMPRKDLLNDFFIFYGDAYTKEHLKKIDKEIREICQNRSFIIVGENANHHTLDKACKILIEIFQSRFDKHLKSLKDTNINFIKKEITADAREINKLFMELLGIQLTKKFVDLHKSKSTWIAMVQEKLKEQKEIDQEIKNNEREEARINAEYAEKIREEKNKTKELEAIYAKVKEELLNTHQNDFLKIQEYQERISQLEKDIEQHQSTERQLSLAQQTKVGHVYVISNIGSFGENIFKIGVTRRLEPITRIKELSNASVPFEFDIHAMIKSDDAPSLEKLLHHKFREYRVNKVNPRKEFFKVSISEIEDCLKNMGLETQFTYKAQALQYLETLKIESFDTDKKEKILLQLEEFKYDEEKEISIN